MQQQEKEKAMQQQGEGGLLEQQQQERTLKQWQESEGLTQQGTGRDTPQQEEEMEEEEQQVTQQQDEMQQQQDMQEQQEEQMMQDDSVCCVTERGKEEREWTDAFGAAAAAEQQLPEGVAAADPQRQREGQRRAEAERQQEGMISAEQQQEEEMVVQEEEELQRGGGSESEEQQEEDYLVLCNLKRVRSEGCVLKRQHLVRSSALPITTAYHMEEVVGVGTWGTVLRVVERCSGLVRAAKKICKESHAKELPRFRQEIALYRQLDHPHIARLYEVFEDHRYIYLVMEYCRGGDLLSWLHRQQDKREKAAAERRKVRVQQRMHEKETSQRRQGQQQEKTEGEKHSEQRETNEKTVEGKVEEHQLALSGAAEVMSTSAGAAGFQAAETGAGSRRDDGRETAGVVAETGRLGTGDNDGVPAAGGRMNEVAEEETETEEEELVCGERQAARFVTQLLSALAYLHQKNIAHRDVKLENLLLIHPFEPEEEEVGRRQERGEAGGVVGARTCRKRAHETRAEGFPEEDLQQQQLWDSPQLQPFRQEQHCQTQQQLQQGEIFSGATGKAREEPHCAREQEREGEKDHTFSKKWLVDSVALVDFGLACRFRPCASGTSAAGRRRGAGRRRAGGGSADGAAGVMRSRVGTVYHLSPYMLKGLPYDEVDSDLWATGVLLYMLLSGTPPFQGNTEAEIMHKIQHTAVDFSAPCWRRVSAECKDLIRRLLYNPFLDAEQQQRQQQQQQQEFQQQQQALHSQRRKRQQGEPTQGQQQEEEQRQERERRGSGDYGRRRRSSSREADEGQRLRRSSEGSSRRRRDSSDSVPSCSSSGEESSSCARQQAMKMKAAAQGWHPNIRRRMDAASTLTHPWFAVCNCPLLRPLSAKAITRSTSSPCCASPACFPRAAACVASRSNVKTPADSAAALPASPVSATASSAAAAAHPDAASSATYVGADFPPCAASAPDDGVGRFSAAADAASVVDGGLYPDPRRPEHLRPTATAAVTVAGREAAVVCRSGGGRGAAAALGVEAVVMEEGETTAYSTGCASFESSASIPPAAAGPLCASSVASVDGAAERGGEAAAAPAAEGEMQHEDTGTAREGAAVAAADGQVQTCQSVGKQQRSGIRWSQGGVSSCLAFSCSRRGTAAGARWLQRGSTLLHSKAAAAACATSEQHLQHQQVVAAASLAAASSAETQCHAQAALKEQPQQLQQQHLQQESVSFEQPENEEWGGSGSRTEQQQSARRKEEKFLHLRRVVSDAAVAWKHQQQQNKCPCPFAADKSHNYSHSSSFSQSRSSSSHSSSHKYSSSSNYSSTARAANASVKRLFSSCLSESSAEEGRSPSSLKSRCRPCSFTQTSSNVASSSSGVPLPFSGSNNHSSSSTAGSVATPDTTPLQARWYHFSASSAAGGEETEAALPCSRPPRRRMRDKYLRFCWSPLCVISSRRRSASPVCVQATDTCFHRCSRNSGGCVDRTENKRQRSSCICSSQHIEARSGCSSHSNRRSSFDASGGSGGWHRSRKRAADLTSSNRENEEYRGLAADGSTSARRKMGALQPGGACNAEKAAAAAVKGKQQSGEEDSSRLPHQQQMEELWSRRTDCVLAACEIRNFRCLCCDDGAAVVAESAALLPQPLQFAGPTGRPAVGLAAAGERHVPAADAATNGEEPFSIAGAAAADTTTEAPGGMLPVAAGAAAAAGEVALLTRVAVAEEEVRKEKAAGEAGTSSISLPVVAVAAQRQLRAATARPSGTSLPPPLLPVPHVHFDAGHREAFSFAAGVSAAALDAAATAGSATALKRPPCSPWCSEERRDSSSRSCGTLLDEKKGDSCPALLQLADAPRREPYGRETQAAAAGAAALLYPAGVPLTVAAAPHFAGFAANRSGVAAAPAAKTTTCAAVVRGPAASAAAAAVAGGPPHAPHCVPPAAARVAAEAWEGKQEETATVAPCSSCVSEWAQMTPSAFAASPAAACTQRGGPQEAPAAILHERKLRRPCSSLCLASECAAAARSADLRVAHRSSTSSSAAGQSRSSSSSTGLLSSSGTTSAPSSSSRNTGNGAWKSSDTVSRSKGRSSSADSSPTTGQRDRGSSSNVSTLGSNVLLRSSSSTDRRTSHVDSRAAAAAAPSSHPWPHHQRTAAADPVAAAPIPPHASPRPGPAGARGVPGNPFGFAADAGASERLHVYDTSLTDPHRRSSAQQQRGTSGQQRRLLVPEQAPQQQPQQPQESLPCCLPSSAKFPSLLRPLLSSSSSPSSPLRSSLRCPSFPTSFSSPVSPALCSSSCVPPLAVSSASSPLVSSPPSPFPAPFSSSVCFPPPRPPPRRPPPAGLFSRPRSPFSLSSSSSSFSSCSAPCSHAAVWAQQLQRKEQGGSCCCPAAADPAQEAVFRCRTLLLLSATAWSSFAALKTLQRAFRTVVAREMSDEVEVRVLRALFAALDRNQKGILSLEDFRWGLLLARDFCTAEFYCCAKKYSSSICHAAAVGGGAAASAEDAAALYTSSPSHSGGAATPPRAASAAAGHGATGGGAVLIRQLPSSSRRASAAAAVFGSRESVVQEGRVGCSGRSNSRNSEKLCCRCVVGCSEASCGAAAVGRGVVEAAAGAAVRDGGGASSGFLGRVWERGSRRALHRLAASLTPRTQLPLLLSGTLKPGLRSLRRLAVLHAAGGDAAPEQLLPYILNVHALLGLPLPAFLLPFTRWLLLRGADETTALEYSSRCNCAKHLCVTSSSNATSTSSSTSDIGSSGNIFSSSRNTSNSSSSNRVTSLASSHVGSDGRSGSSSYRSSEDCSSVPCAQDIFVKGEEAAAVESTAAAGAGRGGGCDGVGDSETAAAGDRELGEKAGVPGEVAASDDIAGPRGCTAAEGSAVAGERKLRDTGSTEAREAATCSAAAAVEERHGRGPAGRSKISRNGEAAGEAKSEARQESRHAAHLSATGQERRRAADEEKGGAAAAAEVVIAGGRGEEAAAAGSRLVETGVARTQKGTTWSEAAGRTGGAGSESAAGDAAAGRDDAAPAGRETVVEVGRKGGEAAAVGKATEGGNVMLNTELSKISEQQQSSSWLDDVVAGMDTDGSGTIEFVEFLAASLDQWDLLHREELCRAAFRYFDRDFDGQASYKDVLTTLSLSPAPSAVSSSDAATLAAAAAGAAADASAPVDAAAGVAAAVDAAGKCGGGATALSQQQLRQHREFSHLVSCDGETERSRLRFNPGTGGANTRARAARGSVVEKRENAEEDAAAAVGTAATESRRGSYCSFGAGQDVATHAAADSVSTAAATDLCAPPVAGHGTSKVAAAKTEEAGAVASWSSAPAQRGGLLQDEETAASGLALLTNEDEEFLQDLDVVTPENLPLYRSVLAEIKAIDANKDGYITYEEFLHLLR